ncbi:glutamine--fructose-6-phosphate transaminase (isomerizing) [Basidiobolus ranarum]|uniref:Glutamine--fructose-6-phosphate transaminase (Isomerizing) n=1 Tax=Basidiobolus ranarum TaxID=34480 RepID=A0ABR2WMG8_9FUNG
MAELTLLFAYDQYTSNINISLCLFTFSSLQQTVNHLQLLHTTYQLTMCGIFTYLNYLVEKDRKCLKTLLNGLSHLEYCGYNSAGLPIDGDYENESGETADIMLALRYSLKRGALCVEVTNTAWPVLKPITSQHIALLTMAIHLSEDRSSMTKRRQDIIEGLQKLPGAIKEAFKLDQSLQRLAKEAL